MLPKEEKNNPQLDSDQPGLFDKENEKDRISKKRKFVYVAMFLTVGLSLSFWIYRYFKNLDFSFKLPTFNFTVSTPKTTNINLPQDSATWSVFLKRKNPDLVIYQNNQDIVFNDEKLNATNFITSSPYSSSLPEGFKIKELVEEKDNIFTYASKIITPNQELLLIVKISNSPDLTQAKKLIPNLVDQLYWYSLQK